MWKTMRFYKNLEDDQHCFQAALLMVLSYFFPKRKYSYKEMDHLTGFKKGRNTWDAKGLTWLSEKGFSITRISDFDYQSFADNGADYLKWFWRPEVYDYQKKFSDFTEGQREVKKLVRKAHFIHRRPQLKDLDTCGKDVSCIQLASVNACALDGRRGFTNHTVVIENIGKTITLSDPGLPPQPHREVSRKAFKKALLELTIICRK